MMKIWSKWISLVALLVFTVSIAGYAEKKAEAAPGPVEIKLQYGSGHPDIQPYVKVAKEFFMPEVEKRAVQKTNYRIKWTASYGGSVAKLGEELEAVERGVLDLGHLASLFEPSKLYMHNLQMYIPFNTPDCVQTLNVMNKLYAAIPEFTKVFEDKYKQKLLVLGSSGGYDIITKFPFNKIEDLNGKKIGASGPNLGLLKGTGAVGVTATLNEAYTSLQTGVYDGVLIFPNGAGGYKLYEPAKYYTKVGFGASAVNFLTINNNVWKKLPKEVQDIMLEVAKETGPKIAQEAAALDAAGLESMKKAGTTITDLPADQKAKWANLLPNIPADTAKDMDKKGWPGTKAFQEYFKILAAEGYKLPRAFDVK